MNRPTDGLKIEQAARTLEQLEQQAEAVRAQLLVLRRELTQAEQEFSKTQGARLLEANEQLVLAAMRAQAIADAAQGSLAAAALNDIAAGEFEARMRALREANENLVLDALSSQELEEDAHAAHTRQVTFLAMVAHELRNPLLPLRLAAQMLARARTDEQAFAKLQATITGQVAQMARLINDLLDGSRVSAGKFRLERNNVEIARVLQDAIEAARPAFEARHQIFKSSAPDSALCVHGDPMRLAQVFSNLLDNASKYTPEGGEISLQAASRGAMVAITIADNGIGISEKALPRVFELFVQDGHAAAMSRGGLGIGLAVVRDLVEAHGGSVVADSDGLNRGSEFVVLLPSAAKGNSPPA